MTSSDHLDQLNSSPTLTIHSSHLLNPPPPTSHISPPHPITAPSILSKFYDQSTFNEFNNAAHTDLILGLNVQSLQSKFENLKTFLLEISKNNNISILALQETWNIPHPNLINMPGFKFVYSGRKCSRGGGVGFFVRDSLNFKKIDNLSILKFI